MDDVLDTTVVEEDSDEPPEPAFETPAPRPLTGDTVLRTTLDVGRIARRLPGPEPVLDRSRRERTVLVVLSRGKVFTYSSVWKSLPWNAPVVLLGSTSCGSLVLTILELPHTTIPPSDHPSDVN